MSSDNIVPCGCRVYENGAFCRASRELAAEAPLRIVVNGGLAATLMRTPGDDEELVMGFLITAGVIKDVDEVWEMSFSAANEARVNLGFGGEPPRLSGRYEVEAVAERIPRFEKPAGRFEGEDIFRLARAMQAAQPIFGRTGGTHAAAVAEMPMSAARGNVIVREDIGRHNAIDKAVGAAARRGMAFERLLLLLSGRLSFEIITKCAAAGISGAAGVSAPSGLGVKLARRLGMFLAGFVRGDTMTVYAGQETLRRGER